MTIITALVAILVGMLGWYLPRLANKVDENQVMERIKLEQIYEIKSSTFELNHAVTDIKNQINAIKKKNEHIYKSVNNKMNMAIDDIRNLCSQVKRYGDTRNWINHPECRVNKVSENDTD